MAWFSRTTEQRAYDDVVHTNGSFRSGQLPAEAYAFWEVNGVVVQAWVLASFRLNDEGPCYCGNIIAPDGQAFFYQVDFSDPDNCAWERVDSDLAIRATPCTWGSFFATSSTAEAD